LFMFFGARKGLRAGISAAFPGFLLVLSYLYWFQSGQAKGGIYIMSHLGAVVCLWALMRMLRLKEASYMYLSAFAAGFLPVLHHSASLFTVAAAVLIIFFAPAKLTTDHKIRALGFFLISFLTPYFYLFIRSGPDKAVCWGGIETLTQILDHITRKVYEGIEQGKFTPDVFLFKLKHYAGQFVYSYKAGVVAALAGAVLLFRASGRAFAAAAVFIGLNTFLLFYLTGYSYAPLNIYVNSGFFLLQDIFILIPACAAVYAAVRAVKSGFFSAVLAGVFFLVPLYNATVNFRMNDQSRKFMAYDNAVNFLRTLSPGDMLFCEEDFQVFNVLYVKTVLKKFPDITAFDRHANFLDRSIYGEFMEIAARSVFDGEVRTKRQRIMVLQAATLKLMRATE
ncbi:MAG TPA: hypothetical protein P5511_09510, partial [Candidatus Goldiibacteriota bacterium]|nr:hypothetical protein [Candidatus Goldiibacteriota bacterium]